MWQMMIKFFMSEKHQTMIEKWQRLMIRLFLREKLSDNDREVAKIEGIIMAPRCISIAPRYVPQVVAEEIPSTS